MEKELIFHVLGIEPTKEESRIRSAYLTLLKSTNPEDDPEGFKRLREAYEKALSLAREQDAEDEAPADDIGLWLAKVDKVYQDIKKRISVTEWEALLSAPVCENLDTSLDARNRLLGYLMDHFQLPQEIWILLDKSFQIIEDTEQLSQQFPIDFLSYVKNHTENTNFLPYELFEIRTPETANVDAYITRFFDLMRSVDQGTPEESYHLLEEMEAFGVYHPYEDIERIHLLLAEEKVSEALLLADEVTAKMPKDSFLLNCLAEVSWAIKSYDKAEAFWRQILDIYPRHYQANCGIIRFYIQTGEYQKAKDLIIKMLDEYGYNEDNQLMTWMDTVNKVLLQSLQEELNTLEPGSHQWKKQFLELGWCLFQNEQEEQAIEMLKDFSPDEDQRYTYENLFGRLLARKEYYDTALPHLKEWLSLIKETPDDGSEENTKRLSRESLACQIIASCLKELNQFEEAEAYLKQAVSSASDPGEEMASRQQMAALLFAAKQYERCIDVCDEIIEKADSYFPAYVQRQEASFELKHAQQVVDDYYNAINIYPGWYKPYLLAAQVFFYFNQYEDAKGVLDRAKDNQVEFSDNLKLFEIKILRNLAQNDEDRNEPIKLCQTLLKEINPEDTDIEDISEISFVLGLLFGDCNRFEDALFLLGSAISKNPERLQYRLVKGHIYREMGKYKEALKEYQAAKPDYENSPVLYYNEGLCYESMKCNNLARDCFKDALALEDNYHDTYEHLADIAWDEYTKHFRPQDYKDAVSYMDKQVELDPCSYYFIERGRIHMAASELTLAIADFEKALEDRPDSWAAYNNMGLCYRRLGNIDKAIEFFKKSIQCFTDTNRSAVAYSNMAECYEIIGDYKSAIECHLKNLELFPDRVSIWEELGDLYADSGEYDKAWDAYSHDKNNENYLTNIGDICFRKGDIKKAIDCYKKSQKKWNTSDSWKDLGWLFLRTGNLEKAKAYYKKAISCENDDDTLLGYEESLALIYYQMKKYAKAKEHAQKALEHFKKSDKGTREDYLNYRAFSPARLRLFGILSLCLGKTEEGLKLLNQMDEVPLCRTCTYKGCFEKYLYLGIYYETAGQLDKAFESYKKAVSLAPSSIYAGCLLRNLSKKLNIEN